MNLGAKKIITNKNIIERNYQVLSTALDAIPIHILSCEEGLLSSVLMANSNQLRNVKENHKVALSKANEQVLGMKEHRLELLEDYADKAELCLS